MLINVNEVYTNTFQSNEKKSKIANFVINEFRYTWVKCPAFNAAGRSRTGHLTSTRPDWQPAPVDPTGSHLCLAVLGDAVVQR